MILKKIILSILLLLIIILIFLLNYYILINNCKSNFNNYEYIKSHKIKYYGIRGDRIDKSLITKTK